MSAFMERVTPVIDETIRTLAKTKFINDPVAGDRYSRATSIVTSALLICAIDKPRSRERRSAGILTVANVARRQVSLARRFS